MRTAGTGREGWMTAIPILVMVFVLTVIVGGPKEMLTLMEGYLRVFVDWVSSLR